MTPTASGRSVRSRPRWRRSDQNDHVDTSAYDAWRALAFPKGSAVDEIDEVHADLAYWDAITFETIGPLAENSIRYDPGVLDFRVELPALRERLLAMRGRYHDAEAAVLDGYVRYADAPVAVNDWAAEVRN